MSVLVACGANNVIGRLSKISHPADGLFFVSVVVPHEWLPVQTSEKENQSKSVLIIAMLFRTVKVFFRYFERILDFCERYGYHGFTALFYSK
jgi:hypothetical protein